jgi:hypothetical protein
MLQKSLPLLLLLPPWDSRLEPRGPRLPVRTLFALQERVTASFFPKAQAGCIRWNQASGKPAASPRDRTYQRMVDERLTKLARTPGLRAGVQCSLGQAPGQDEAASISEKLVLYNNGDEFGEEREGNGPVTCDPQSLRDLRDLAAAQLADWPGGVALNQGVNGGAFISARRGVDRFSWVHMEFSGRLWMKPDGTLFSKRVREFSVRLESILTLWCRLQGW